jgi:hypothetical protein
LEENNKMLKENKAKPYEFIDNEPKQRELEADINKLRKDNEHLMNEARSR